MAVNYIVFVASGLVILWSVYAFVSLHVTKNAYSSSDGSMAIGVFTMFGAVPAALVAVGLALFLAKNRTAILFSVSALLVLVSVIGIELWMEHVKMNRVFNAADYQRFVGQDFSTVPNIKSNSMGGDDFGATTYYYNGMAIHVSKDGKVTAVEALKPRE